MLTSAVLAALLVVLPAADYARGSLVPSSREGPHHLVAASVTRWAPPVSPFRVVEPYNAPQPDWLPGHRGVDLAAVAGEQLRAPALGVISFAGLVAGKPVVTIDHGLIRTTYEPAVATVPLGRLVVAGEHFADTATGGHCAGDCVHWGARIGERYLDPLWLIEGYTPVLKSPR